MPFSMSPYEIIEPAFNALALSNAELLVVVQTL
jgi:hypothetical protein